MPKYHDSVGNTYDRLPPAPPVHNAKRRKNKPLPKRVSAHGRPGADYPSARQRKYSRYRANRGRPNGPGQPGNKSGKNKLR